MSQNNLLNEWDIAIIEIEMGMWQELNSIKWTTWWSWICRTFTWLWWDLMVWHDCVNGEMFYLDRYFRQIMRVPQWRCDVEFEILTILHNLIAYFDIIYTAWFKGLSQQYGLKNRIKFLLYVLQKTRITKLQYKIIQYQILFLNQYL